jgi:hypothetical protein
VNRTAHTAFVAVANGDDVGPLTTADGSFELDLRALLVELADRLGLPGTTVERIPVDAGRLTVFDSEQVDALQQAVRAVELLSIYLFVLVVALYASAVVAARNRRTALRNVGLAIVVGSTLLLVARQVAIDAGVDQLARAESSRAAVESLVSIASSLLDDFAWAWLAIGVVMVLFSIVVGPSRAAVAVRRWIAPVMTQPVGAWALALGVLALYLVLAPGPSFERWLPALVLVALYVAAFEFLRRQVVAEHPVTPEGV